MKHKINLEGVMKIRAKEDLAFTTANGGKCLTFYYDFKTEVASFEITQHGELVSRFYDLREAVELYNTL